MTTQTHTTVKNVDIVPRHMGFEFPAETPKYWFGGDPWSTHLLNALSLTFPRGEAAFVHSVREVRERLKDPKLIDEVRAFIAQESHHGKEHDTFNEWLRAQGAPVDSVYAQIDKNIAENRKNITKETDLAITTALEHFTAILAHGFLTTPELTDEMDENVKWLWLWHAIEETEHKAVAFDVYEAIGGTYRMRVAVMMVVTRLFLFNTARFHLELLRNDGQLTNARSVARFLWRFWGPRGHFSKLLPAYLEYYRKDFHPWQHDNRDAVARWKTAVESRAKRVGPGTRKTSAEAA
jgi:uncharacterized protein